MNVKSANKVLCNVFDKFVASITDDKVRGMVRNNTIITGGAIVSLLTGDRVNDYDLYFRNLETCRAVAEYYAREFSSDTGERVVVLLDDKNKDEPTRIKVYIASSGTAGELPEEYNEELDPMETNISPDTDIESAKEVTPKYTPVYFTSNAITLSGKIQLVIRFYGEPDVLHENYDFVHCMNYWDSYTRSLTVRPDALAAILAKELVYKGSKYPLCSIIRTRKFIKRGWSINAGQYLKMCFQISKLDLSNRKVLEEQLVGVDSTYFGILISALTAESERTGVDAVDETYVAEIIDKIF